MFLRLLWESFARQRRRKALAGIAILLGTTAVTAMLALATTIGDRIHRELAVYGANIVVTPKADTLDVKVGGENLKPATGEAYLKESDLEKLKGIFWANNITGVSPEFRVDGRLLVTSGSGRPFDPRIIWHQDDQGLQQTATTPVSAVGYWSIIRLVLSPPALRNFIHGGSFRGGGPLSRGSNQIMEEVRRRLSLVLHLQDK